MADADLYDIDILAWSEQQAEALRSLTGRRDLPNPLDLSHVVEEIEDVGLSQMHHAQVGQSFRRRLSSLVALPFCRSALNFPP
jgi:hypothetical protein